VTELSSQRYLAVIDENQLRRSGLSGLLSNWAQTHGLVLAAAASPAEAAQTDMIYDSDLVVLSVGAASLRGDAAATKIRALRALASDAPVAIIADMQDPLEIAAAFGLGAAAYIPTTMPPEIVLAALTFLLHGGTFFPPEALLCLSELEPPVAGPAAGDLSLPSAGEDPPASAAALALPRPHANGCSPPHGLTFRQIDVLLCLGSGQSNKHIARMLGMTEATVKSHMRQIIRKLGVVNRTQAAMYAAQIQSDRRLAAGLRQRPLDS